ncbi:Clavaminate synthase-like protein [Mycena chlorophos]|uniref:Clavaminate synthase-like protein n=1 Tax=Mycena chlorophos TaxID=658473 RepID=A0A8H6SSP4_MYCCL|nr:Clavaminate synthase-like protein [Mycena chlorophos]
MSSAAQRLFQVISALNGGFEVAQKAPPAYVAPEATKEKLDYADLPFIDLALARTPEGRKALAQVLVDAMHTHGFFYVVNHGYTPEQTARIFSIANETFDTVPEAEKEAYRGKNETVYEGYKQREAWTIGDGVRDQIEQYSVNRKVLHRAHPQALRPYLAEMQAFAKHNHMNILHPILRLMAIGLELPEESFVEQHLYDAPGESSVRFLKYHPRSIEDEQKTKQVWLKGHTDIGSITILWSQPISGLQILSPDNQWRWVRHVENALVINAGDVMTFLAGGFYPATRHRVVRPPADQVNLPRLGVFYFAMANDGLKLLPHEESPVLQRVGIKRVCKDEDAPTMHQWRSGLTAAYGRTVLVPSKSERGVEEDLIGGIVVKHYN